MDAPLSAHLVHALALHRKWCQRSGVPFPSLLDAVLAELARPVADSDGLAWPILGDSTPAADPVLVNYQTASAKLGVSERTVRRLVAAGRLPVVRVRGRALLRVSDLDAYVDGAA